MYHVLPPEPARPERSRNLKSSFRVAQADSAPQSFDKYMRGLRRRESSLSIRSILVPCSVMVALHGWNCQAKHELYHSLPLIARAGGTTCDILLDSALPAPGKSRRGSLPVAPGKSADGGWGVRGRGAYGEPSAWTAWGQAKSSTKPRPRPLGFSPSSSAPTGREESRVAFRPHVAAPARPVIMPPPSAKRWALRPFSERWSAMSTVRPRPWRRRVMERIAQGSNRSVP